MIHGNCNYIGYFVRQVEWRRSFKLNGSNGRLRPIAILIVHRFTGENMSTVARYFGMNRRSISDNISNQLKYEEINDPGFIKNYNELLTLFIDSSKHFIRRKH